MWINFANNLRRESILSTPSNFIPTTSKVNKSNAGPSPNDDKSSMTKRSIHHSAI